MTLNNTAVLIDNVAESYRRMLDKLPETAKHFTAEQKEAEVNRVVVFMCGWLMPEAVLEGNTGGAVNNISKQLALETLPY